MLLVTFFAISGCDAHC